MMDLFDASETDSSENDEDSESESENTECIVKTPHREFWVNDEVVNERSGHVSVVYTDQLIVWGGIDRNKYKFLPAQQLFCYSLEAETWTCWRTGGQIPPGRSGSSACIVDTHMYIICGYDEDVSNRTSRMWSLDLKRMVWMHLEPKGQLPLNCDKGAGWVFGEKIFIFGGFGPSPTSQDQPGLQLFDFTEMNDEVSRELSGWSNQFVCYDPSTNTWEWPKTHGRPPLPRAGHAVAIVRDHAYIFGGRHGNCRLSDLHRISMTSMTWETIHLDSSAPTPPGRSWHSMVNLGVGSDTLLLFGGYSESDTPLKDSWQIDTSAKSPVWTKSSHSFPRSLWWHTMEVIGSSVVVIGGLHSEHCHPRQCLILDLQPLPLTHICHKALRHDMDFHLRNKSLLDLPRSLLSVILSQKLTISSNNYENMRKLAEATQELEISRRLLKRIRRFCKRYPHKS